MIVFLGLVTAVAGCGTADRAGGGQPTTAPTATATTPGASPSGPATGGPTGGSTAPAGVGSGYRVTYGWAVPSARVRVPHTVKVPIAPPPAAPLPVLRSITVGDHPGERPAYSRISFAFLGATPEYNFQYVPEVLSEGAGDHVPLEGNSFLRIQFVHAQAHDAAGKASVTTKPASRLGFRNLLSYGFGGDFEGYVTYGLGIQVVPGSDQALPIRVGESRRSDGTYVISFDVRYG